MGITKEEVFYIANLARLDISEDEAESFTSGMESMIGFADMLSEVDTSYIEPTSHAMEINNVFREDVCKESYSANILLSNAPDKSDEYYLVPKTARSDKK